MGFFVFLNYPALIQNGLFDAIKSAYPEMSVDLFAYAFTMTWTNEVFLYVSYFQLDRTNST